jgi:hypothetical protein
MRGSLTTESLTMISLLSKIKTSSEWIVSIWKPLGVTARKTKQPTQQDISCIRGTSLIWLLFLYQVQHLASLGLLFAVFLLMFL